LSASSFRDRGAVALKATEQFIFLVRFRSDNASFQLDATSRCRHVAAACKFFSTMCKNFSAVHEKISCVEKNLMILFP